MQAIPPPRIEQREDPPLVLELLGGPGRQLVQVAILTQPGIDPRLLSKTPRAVPPDRAPVPTQGNCANRITTPPAKSGFDERLSTLLLPAQNRRGIILKYKVR